MSKYLCAIEGTFVFEVVEENTLGELSCWYAVQLQAHQFSLHSCHLTLDIA